MKIEELLLIGAGAYLLFFNKGASADLSGFSGSVPGTIIPASPGFTAKAAIVAPTPAAAVTKAKTTSLGSIKVNAAPVIKLPTAAAQVLQKNYIMGNFTPSSFLAGKPTATDLIIAQNIAKMSFKL